MKKIVLILLIGLTVITVSAVTNNFKIDSTKLSTITKKNELNNSFNKEYNLNYVIENKNTELEERIIELTKKTTFLLMGDFNNTNETSENYYKRREDFLDLIYSPEIPLNPDGTYDENSEEYKDSSHAGWLAGLFLSFDEWKTEYSYFGNIRVTIMDDMIMSMISLPNAKIKIEDKNNPMQYKTITTNIINYYFFKENKGEYQLYEAMGETVDDLSEYFTETENKENSSTMSIAPSYDSDLKNVYDFSKLDLLSELDLKNIYEKNNKNIVILTSYYNNQVINQGHGIIINNGLIVTTFSFLEEALLKSQHITVKDGIGNYYEMDGIVTINQENDVAIIKLKEKTDTKVVLGELNNVKIEDAVISISSKTGIGLSIQTGIIISTEGFIQTTIPLQKTDEGSPIIDLNGNIIGLNTSRQTNTSISLAINVEVLKEIQNKFNNIEYESIKAITFNELKEKFYYTRLTEEIIKNNIPNKVWKKYKKIGKIEENIKLELVKANYTNNTISLRYSNKISDFMSTMQFASSFKNELIKEGFKEKLNSTKKCIYQNKEYQIVIMEEFDYLIIVMVKL